MAQLNRHPAPGNLGDILPGWYSVPQNPITGGPGGPVTYAPTIGDILPGASVVPQNPVKDFATGQVRMIGQNPQGGGGQLNGVDVSDCGCGCGGGGKCGTVPCGCGLPGGIGDISTDLAKVTSDLTSLNLVQAVQDTVLGLPVWGWATVAYLLLFMGGSQSHANRARRAVRAY